MLQNWASRNGRNLNENCDVFERLRNWPECVSIIVDNWARGAVIGNIRYALFDRILGVSTRSSDANRAILWSSPSRIAVVATRILSLTVWSAITIPMRVGRRVL